jgi:HlyD family secretion protein
VGRIVPGDGVVRLAARSLSGQPSIIARLFVREGDHLAAGQPVAELDSRAQLEAAAGEAAARVDVARQRLAQVMAGAKPSDIAAQQAEVDRLRTELATYRKEYERHVSLGDIGTPLELDRAKLRADTTERALASATERLASLRDVRPVDVDVARAELQAAFRNEARARAEHAASVVTAPIAGRVVTVHAREGEVVSADGVIELAPLEPIHTVAEVPEADIARVRIGQRATVTGDGLARPLHGTVERVGLAVNDNRLRRLDPAAFSDARVVETWIRMDDGRAVADRIHLRVDVVIQE